MIRKSFKFQKYFSTLIIADTNTSFSNLPNLISAGKNIDEKFDVWLTGENINNQLDLMKSNKYIHSINKFYTLENEIFKYSNYLALSMVSWDLINKENYNNIIMSNSVIAKETLPYISGKFDSQPITEITKILSNNEFERPIYAGNAFSKVECTSDKKFLSLRATSFEKLEENFDLSSVEVIKLNNYDFSKLKFKVNSEEIVKNDKPSLSSAKYVVSGGRALKSKENFKILEELSDTIGNCAIGASRAAVDAGYINNDLQVGQTGKVVAPQVYFAFGISGAIQHIAGIKDSKYIVAVNTDKEAPIFQVSDYGLVGDLFKIIPELNEKLKK